MHIANKLVFPFLMLSAALLAGCASSGGANPGADSERGALNLNERLLPAPKSSKFEDPAYYIWCGSTIKGDDGLWHMYYSRWPRAYHHNAWVTHCQIAHAVSDSPFGPWKHSDVALPARGPEFWDGMCTHNPTVKKFGGKYYIYYTGNRGDGKVGQPGNYKALNFSHRNNQRIGVAVSDSPYGPWKRFDKPIVDVSDNPDAPDALCTTNPTVTDTPDGKYLMIYKGVAAKKPKPFGGPVVHLTALADNPVGPFIKNPKPIFTAEGSDFAAEDPYVWKQDGDCFYAMAKDMKGSFVKEPKGFKIVLFSSEDGLNWKPAKHTYVINPQILWEDGKTQKLMHLERPQCVFDGGKLIALGFAADVDREHSFNVTIPLKQKQN